RRTHHANFGRTYVIIRQQRRDLRERLARISQQKRIEGGWRDTTAPPQGRRFPSTLGVPALPGGPDLGLLRRSPVLVIRKVAGRRSDRRHALRILPDRGGWQVECGRTLLQSPRHGVAEIIIGQQSGEM